MNFLELCQRTRERCAISSSTGGPVSVVGQTGQMLKVVHLVNDAWMAIQRLHRDWLWMRDSFSFPTVAGQHEYTLAQVGVSNLLEWHTDTLRIERQSIGRTDRQDLPHMGYLDWRRTYDMATVTSERPACFSVRPQNFQLLLGGTPDAVYTVSGEYQHCATEMAANTDTPGLPAAFHMLIVYKAMLLHAAEANAPEVDIAGQRGWVPMLAELESNQRPAIGLGEPLLVE